MPADSRHRKNQCFSLNLEGRKKLVFPFKGSWAEDSLSYSGKGQPFLFHACLPLIGWGPPTLGRAICFTQFPNLNVQLIQSTQNVWPNIWALHGPVKLVHKINHYRNDHQLKHNRSAFSMGVSNKPARGTESSPIKVRQLRFPFFCWGQRSGRIQSAAAVNRSRRERG